MHTGYIQSSARYVWDTGKARLNLAKHGADFADAALVLEDPRALTIDEADRDELRFVTLGMDPNGRLLVVVHALGSGETFRIISARRASPRERAAHAGPWQGEGMHDEQS